MLLRRLSDDEKMLVRWQSEEEMEEAFRYEL